MSKKGYLSMKGKELHQIILQGVINLIIYLFVLFPFPLVSRKPDRARRNLGHRES